MAKTKIFKLALDEEYYKKVEELQMVLPGQMYKSDVIRAAIDYLYSSFTPNEIRTANGLTPIISEVPNVSGVMFVNFDANKDDKGFWRR